MFNMFRSVSFAILELERCKSARILSNIIDADPCSCRKDVAATDFGFD